MTLREKFENAPVSGALFSSLTPAENMESDIMAKISMTICDKRKEMGMNQKQFANFMGVSQGMISKWENAEYNNFTLKRICEIYSKLGLNFYTNDAKIIEPSSVKVYITVQPEYQSSAALPGQAYKTLSRAV